MCPPEQRRQRDDTGRNHPLLTIVGGEGLQLLFVVVQVKAEEEQMEVVQWLGSIDSNQFGIERIEFSVVTLVPAAHEPFFGENFATFHVESRLKRSMSNAESEQRCSLPDISRRDWHGISRG